MPRPKRIVGDAKEGIFSPNKKVSDDLDEFRNEYLRLRNETKNTKQNYSGGELTTPKTQRRILGEGKGIENNGKAETKTQGRYQDQPGERPMATERINYSGGEQTSASKRPKRIVGEAKTPTVQFNGGEVSGTKREKRVLSDQKTNKVEFQGGETTSASKKVERAATEGKGINKARVIGKPKQNVRQMQKQNMMTGVSAQNGKLTLNDDVRSRLEKGFASVQKKRKDEAYKMKKPKGY